MGKVRIFDPVAGGEALLVLDVGDVVRALAVFVDPATGAPRLVRNIASGEVFDPVAGGALLVMDVGGGERWKQRPGDGREASCRERRWFRSRAATRCSC